MSNIKIPEKFEKIIIGQSRAIVDSTVNLLSDIYIDNKLEFFQDYTDHGIKHIEKVLETASQIIDDESYKLLNEKDISVLILSVLLHDLGMHLKSAGLKSVLSGGLDSFRVDFFNKKTWSEEWAEFFQEAKRFNDEQLKDIFGKIDVAIEEPDLEKLDNYTRTIYGEFLRRHHPRLAHEIALGGFPGDKLNENMMLISEGVNKDILDIAGLIARSHGIPLRGAFDYLEEKFSDAWRTPFDIKAVFLMVVLRIADYLQIESDRASKIILKSKRISSPISRQEWEKHASIADVRANTTDPERIFVLAQPTNSNIFLELEKLFKDIQLELDTSWAILGEVHGKDDNFKNLKIKYRRIRSTLDDKPKFSKTIAYIPEKVVFDADPQLLKLLIGPLYGEDPKYGVRELLQNSVDAEKERRYLNKIENGILIKLDSSREGVYDLTIQDRGIGMSKDTLTNYFFKAGASFRKSLIWRKNFIENNETQVQRTGRFGVGVLAAFLLGDEFELWTKYDSKETQGYYCKASLSMRQIEMQKKDCEIGTTIKIRLRDDAAKFISDKLDEKKSLPLLEWFTWYRMDEPKIEFQMKEDLRKIFRWNNHDFVSSNPERLNLGWYRLSTRDYKAIHWKFPTQSPYNQYYDFGNADSQTNILICNGFGIKRDYVVNEKSYRWMKPVVSIFDNNGKLPLSLNRD